MNKEKIIIMKYMWVVHGFGVGEQWQPEDTISRKQE